MIVVFIHWVSIKPLFCLTPFSINFTKQAVGEHTSIYSSSITRKKIQQFILRRLDFFYSKTKIFCCWLVIVIKFSLNGRLIHSLWHSWYYMSTTRLWYKWVDERINVEEMGLKYSCDCWSELNYATNKTRLDVSQRFCLPSRVSHLTIH